MWVRGFGILTNKISQVAIGKSATDRKRKMNLPKHDTPRNYESIANLVLIGMTELTSGGLHLHRESEGLGELLDDISDTSPIIDAARPELYKAFSQKPRRLRSGAVAHSTWKRGLKFLWAVRRVLLNKISHKWWA